MDEKKIKPVNTADNKSKDKEKGDLDDFIFSQQENKKCSEK
ncbi:MAG: hypothetical protein JG777_623 [Clostridia bacterium]|jgi:hypothetical protein|nr:hypothetical protein [Clostridia bacterium]